MRQIIRNNGTVITLNSQQNEALDLMAEWAKSDSLFFMLSGYAGTGKTTIVKEFLVDSEFRMTAGTEMDFMDTGAKPAKPEIAVSAPTHKAKKEISKSTGLEGKTIQSLLGLGLDVDIADFDPEDKKFKQTRTPELKNYQLIVIDEGSMLNSESSKFIFELAKQHGTRILFMGDKAQLPPINEAESIIFSSSEILYRYELTKVERQASDNPIMGIYDTLRDNLNSKATPYKKITNFNEDTQSGIKFLPYANFAKEILEDFTKEHFDPLEAKILCWSNKEVGIWNNAIRRRILQKKYPGTTNFGLLEIGDHVISVANRGAIHNADEFIIKQISKSPRNFYDVNGAIQSIECLVVTAYSDSTGTDVYFNVLDHGNPRAMGLWLLHYNDFVRAAVKDKKRWRDFFSFRDVFLVNDIIENPRGGKPITKDLDYAYALTVHRSQGSTYDNVYVVETDLDKNRNVRERNQLKYVALSRPRKKAVLLSI
jgi:ATP-dependent exoDNAse (exonuclease V) alpha subunit